MSEGDVMKKFVDGQLVTMSSKEETAFAKQQALDSTQLVAREGLTPAAKLEAIGLTVEELKSLVEST